PTSSGGASIASTLRNAPLGWAATWLLFRAVGAVVTVPLAEELTFRGFLTRRLISADFDAVPLGRFTWFSFIASSILFGVLHEQWLAGILTGMIYAGVVYRRGKLADAVIAHAATNCVVGLFSLAKALGY
ncbi:MAG: CAAX prenyl protease-related protein, partial [Candidatus Acidiferrum sp.]